MAHGCAYNVDFVVPSRLVALESGTQQKASAKLWRDRMNRSGTLVPTTQKSLALQDGRLARLLGRDVAAQSTPLDETFYEEQMVILLAILTGLSRNVLNPDVMWLSADEAKTYCRKMGMDEGTVTTALNNFLDIAQQARRKNPLNCLFE